VGLSVGEGGGAVGRRLITVKSGMCFKAGGYGKNLFTGRDTWLSPNPPKQIPVRRITEKNYYAIRSWHGGSTRYCKSGVAEGSRTNNTTRRQRGTRLHPAAPRRPLSCPSLHRRAADLPFPPPYTRVSAHQRAGEGGAMAGARKGGQTTREGVRNRGAMGGRARGGEGRGVWGRAEERRKHG